MSKNQNFMLMEKQRLILSVLNSSISINEPRVTVRGMRMTCWRIKTIEIVDISFQMGHIHILQACSVVVRRTFHEQHEFQADECSSMQLIDSNFTDHSWFRFSSYVVSQNDYYCIMDRSIVILEINGTYFNAISSILAIDSTY